MISHVIEYSCQYSDKIKKKHKTWHDGKLKYFEANKRFLLYPEDSNVLISSNFITNSREVSTILCPDGFNTNEHKIFSRAVVIITEKLCEYDREVQVQMANDKHCSNPHIEKSIVSRVKMNDDNTVGLPKAKQMRLPKKRILMNKETDYDQNVGGSSLALKFNRQFKPPRMVESHNSIVTTSKRPYLRDAKIVEQKICKTKTVSPILHRRETRNNLSLPHLGNSLQNGRNVTTEHLKHVLLPELKSKNETVTIKSKKRVQQNLKVKKVNHSPIVL